MPKARSFAACKHQVLTKTPRAAPLPDNLAVAGWQNAVPHRDNIFSGVGHVKRHQELIVTGFKLKP